jgi:hypothetical protein
MDEDDRKKAKKLIFKKLANTSVGHITSSSTSSSSSSSSSTTVTTTTKVKLNSLEKLAALCGHTVSSSTASNQAMTLDEELSTYIKAAKTADNFQSFWVVYGKKLPRLSSLVRRVNVIPATSVASEALFSIASFLHRKQRSSLSSRTLRYLLVLKNRHLIDKLEQNY